MFRKFLAVIVSLVLVALTVILVWIGLLEKRVLDPNFYKSLIADSSLYDTVVEWQWQALTGQASVEAKAIAQGIGFDKFNQAIRQVAPPEFLSDQIGPAVTSFRDWLKGQAPPEELSITFNLAEFKRRLPVVMHEILGGVVANLSICSAGELRQLAGGNLTWCRPAFITPTAFTRQLEQGLPIQQIVRQVPDSISWRELLFRSGSESLRHNLLEVRNNYQEAKRIVGYVWISWVVLWIILIVLLIPWWRLMVEWLGAVVVTIGGIQLALYATLPWLATFVWQQTAAGWPAASRVDTDQVQELLETVVRSLNQGLLVLAVVCVVGGGAIWGIAYLIKK